MDRSRRDFPPARSIPEARAYEVLREILVDLMQVERTLRMVQGAMPDDEREQNLAAIRVAREALQQFL